MTVRNLRLNPNEPHLIFYNKSLHLLERAALALNGTMEIDHHDGRVPGVEIPGMTVQAPRRPLDVVRPETCAWIVGCAVRDWLELLSIYLKDTYLYCALIDSFEGFEALLDPAAQRKITDGMSKFEGLGFPDQVDRLEKSFEGLIGPEVECVKSLSRARNCIVHRLGVVSERDWKEDGHLVIRWKEPNIFVQNPGEAEQRASPDLVIRPEGKVLQRVEEKERRLAAGERISLSTTDLVGVWWTLNHFAHETGKRVFAFARRKGLASGEAAAPQTPG